MKMKVLFIAAAGLFLSGGVFAQDEDMTKLLQDDPAGKKEWKTGFNGKIPMETIVKAMQGTKSGLGSELNAGDEDYAAAADIIANFSACTDASCEITGNDKFLGKGVKLDAAINMVEYGKDKGLKIDLKLINTITGEVLKTMSVPFDPNTEDALNKATMIAAKGLLSKDPVSVDNGEKDASGRPAVAPGGGAGNYVGEGDTDPDAIIDAAYRKHYDAGIRAFNKKQFSTAAKKFRLALEEKETPQARAKLNESNSRIKSAAR